MVPVAGSAYTYAYATLGELVAWIIGWDLILEYAIGSCYVANGWSSYFDSLLQHVFHVQLDPRLLSPPWNYDVQRRRSSCCRYVTLQRRLQAMAWFNLPAVVITLIITVILVVGIKESAGFNAAMVHRQHRRGPHRHRRGSRLRRPGQLAPVPAQGHGLSRHRPGGGPHLHRLRRVRLDLDPRGGGAEPQRDVALGIMGALAICTVLYVADRRRADRHDPLPADQRGRSAGRGPAEQGAELRRDAWSRWGSWPG